MNISYPFPPVPQTDHLWTMKKTTTSLASSFVIPATIAKLQSLKTILLGTEEIVMSVYRDNLKYIFHLLWVFKYTISF